MTSSWFSAQEIGSDVSSGSLSQPSQTEVGSLPLTVPHLCLYDNSRHSELQFNTCLFSPHYMVNISRQCTANYQIDTVY